MNRILLRCPSMWYMYEPTPLYQAVCSKNNKLILSLIHNGASQFNQKPGKSQEKESYLGLALRRNYKLSLEAFQALIEPGTVNYDCLHYAALNCVPYEYFQLLINAGADITLRYPSPNNTPVDTYLKLYTSWVNRDIKAEVIKILIHPAANHNMNIHCLFNGWMNDPPGDLENVVSSFSTLLVYANEDNTLHLGNAIGVTGFSLRVNNEKTFALTIDQLQEVNLLLRKGMLRRKSLQCTSLIQSLDDPPEDMVRKLRDMDAMWDSPFSLVEECCCVIRSKINHPKLENIQKLGLPKKLKDLLLFLEPARQIWSIKDSFRK